MTDFDWVKARSECSLVAAFIRLKKNIRSDVEAANQLYKDIHRKFGIIVHDGGTFAVYEDAIPHQNVTFKLNESRISVSGECDGQDEVKFFATLTLNKDKKCMLLVGGDELEEWQFRKRALEAIFFLEP
jgi:hypothetical protein